MKRTVTVVFDGEVLRPTEPLDLERNAQYQVTIEQVGAPERAASRTLDATEQNGATANESDLPRERQPGEPGLFDDLLSLATDMGISDFAEQHDHYLYGTPKR